MICHNYNLSEMIQNQYGFYPACIFVATGAKWRYTGAWKHALDSTWEKKHGFFSI